MTPLRKIKTGMRAFSRRNEGMAAAEFALVLPMLLAFWIGVAMAGQVESRSTAVNNAAATLADMVAQEGGGDAPTLMRAIESTFRPEDVPKLYLKVTKVVIPSRDDGGSPSVVWWFDNKGGRGGAGGSFSLPPAMSIPGPTPRHIMVADGEMAFEPKFGSAVVGSFPLTHRALFAPRNSQ